MTLYMYGDGHSKWAIDGISTFNREILFEVDVYGIDPSLKNTHNQSKKNKAYIACKVLANKRLSALINEHNAKTASLNNFD